MKLLKNSNYWDTGRPRNPPIRKEIEKVTTLTSAVSELCCLNIRYQGNQSILKVVMDQGPVGSGVSHLWFGFGKFPLKILNLSILYTSGQKNLFRLGQKELGSKTVWPLICCRSKVCSSQVRAHL